ncbi:MAG TPA: oligosaccharide repeat unit polymerase [Candidatus Rifleibacterium sp.]|nr:oligosaccharide repeat unit polymerase [Candidatus Rifleibacterium sp.]
MVLKVFFCTSWTIISILVGMIFARRVIGIKMAKKFSPFRPLNNKEVLIYLSFLCLCFFVLLIYVNQLPDLAIIRLVEGGSLSEVHMARSSMTNDFAGKLHRYEFFTRDLMRFLTFVFFANYLHVRRKGALIIFSTAFIIAAFSSLMATRKSPIFVLILGLFFIYVQMCHNGRFPVKALIKLCIFILLLLIILYEFFMGKGDAISALTAAFSRIITGGIAPAYFYLEYFPAHQDFLFGRSFPNPGGVMPFTPYRLPVEIMNWKFPNLFKLGIVGSMPTIFWGEMYANFGFLGVFLSPFGVGILVYLITWLSRKLPNNATTYALIVYLALHYQELSGRGLGGFLVDFYIVSLLAFVLLAIAFANNGKIAVIWSRRLFVRR